jgi:hypothetical protein
MTVLRKGANFVIISGAVTVSEYSDPLSSNINKNLDTYLIYKSKSKSFYDRRPVGQSVLVSGKDLAPEANFAFLLLSGALSDERTGL